MWPVASAMLTDMEDAGAVASQETKTQILRAVIEFRLESDEHVTHQVGHGLDADPLVALTADDLRRAVRGMMEGELTPERVQSWAWFLFARDDVEPESPIVDQVVAELDLQDLNGAATRDNCLRWLEELDAH